MFRSIKKSGEVLSKLKSRDFSATSLSTYDFSTLYTTLPHNLIKEIRVDLIERAFKKFYKNEGTLYLACNDRKAFFSLLQTIEDIHFGLVRMYVTHYRILLIIFTPDLVISYTDKLVFRWVQIVLLL